MSCSKFVGLRFATVFERLISVAVFFSESKVLTEFANILCSRDAGIAIITLNRADKLNPLDWQTIKELLSCVRQLEGDKAIRVVTITGAGRAFSAGGDLNGYLDLYTKADEFRTFLQDFFSLCEEIERSEKIFIAAVNGVAVAGGIELILACDLVLMAAEAKIGDGHLNFAQLPGAGGSQRLPRTVGVIQAKRLMLTGDLIDAEEAKAIGLVTKVIPGAELERAAQDLARSLLGKSAAALKGAKHLVNEGATMARGKALAMEMDFVHDYATNHPDAMEGLRAFQEKRPAKFRDQD